ncbi:hypothetical protein HNP38_001296 [Chryseobacterium defluvii]|uniref:Uncharacterized protein n=1 Tax=Chryseobacterium defluvii TaxID=160396 RepID=A0A840KE43_9FLAO|nr:hypothetical protein [Chryseobacterium defluvii]MBB4806024.1 hypothetical protein [Chryseobacterium defluvii]
MEELVFGSFHFRLTASRNLIGEYFNNHGNTILTESANFANSLENSSSLFEAEYITSWLEGNKPYSYRMRIERIPNTNAFNVLWTTIRNNTPVFRGKAALLEENTIYGYYSGETFIPEH